MEVKNICIGTIYTSPMNPRKTFDQESLRELADNIGSQGLLQPITVRPIYRDEVIDGDVVTTTTYEIVCGERRYRAYRAAFNEKKVPEEIPCIVREMTDAEAREAMITENLMRSDVDPMEEAAAFSALAEMGQSVKELAARFGKSERFINDRIRLNGLLDRLKKRVTEGNLPINGAMLISKLNAGNQERFANAFEDDYKTSIYECQSFINKILCDLKYAPWMKAPKWESGRSEGACKTCKCNTANAGCLFYEMKVEEGCGKCTNPSCFNRKKIDYALHRIESDKRIIKNGESIEFGKVAIVYSFYGNRKPDDINTLKAALEEKGYHVYDTDEVFSRKVYYDFKDERTQELIAKKEAVECLSIGSYGGVELNREVWCLKRASSEDSNVAIDPKEVERRKLNEQREKAVKNANEHMFVDLKKLLEDSSYFKRVAELTKAEQKAMLICMICELGYGNPLENEIERKGGSTEKTIDILEAMNGEPNRIIRAWMQKVLGGVSEWQMERYRPALDGLMMDQYSEETMNIGESYRKKLDKKLSSIKKKLDALE